MPSAPGYKRDYKQENNYKKKPAQIKKRVKRNAARRKMEAAGKVRKGDGKDVHHADNNTNNNSKSNLKPVKASKNRSFSRKGKGAKKYGKGK